MALVTQMTVAGNLTRDPELRYGKSGQAVASFTIASTPRTFNRETKEYVDGEAIFTNCSIWGKPAENLAASAQKGSRVIASGALKSRTYQTKDGETKTATELIAEEVGLSVAFATVTAERAGSRRPAAPANDGWPTDDSDTPF